MDKTENPLRAPCGKMPTRMNWMMRLKYDGSIPILAPLCFQEFGGRRNWGELWFTSCWITDEGLSRPNVSTYIPDKGTQLYIPMGELPTWAERRKQSQSGCQKLQANAEKTRTEATLIYDKLFSAVVKEDLAGLRAPDGRGYHGLAAGFEERANSHIKDMTAEPTCQRSEIKKYLDAMEVLVSEIRKLEILSQGAWG